MSKVFYEIWVRKKDKKGRLQPFSFVQAFPLKRWQFAIKMRRTLLDKGFQTLLREITVTKEEKSGVIH